MLRKSLLGGDEVEWEVQTVAASLFFFVSALKRKPASGMRSGFPLLQHSLVFGTIVSCYLQAPLRLFAAEESHLHVSLS